MKEKKKRNSKAGLCPGPAPTHKTTPAPAVPVEMVQSAATAVAVSLASPPKRQHPGLLPWLNPSQLHCC